MSLQRKDKRDILNFMNHLGIKVDREEMGGTHWKIYVSCKTYKYMFVVSVTPSDRRGRLNFKADVRRWIKSLPVEGG